MKKLLLIICVLISIPFFSQKQQVDFNKGIKKVIDNKLKTYKEINKELRPFKRDTIKIKEMIAIFEDVDFLYGKAYAENQLGIRYRNYSLYQKAIEFHKKGLATAKQVKSTEFQVFSLNMIGVVYRRMDDYRTALDYSQEALELAEKVKNSNRGIQRGIAIAHNSMGNIYLLLKQYDLAISQFEQSQIIEKSIHNDLGLAINYQNIGYAKQAQNRIDEALIQFKKSLKINQRINNELGKIICNSSIANIYIHQGKVKEALSLINNNLPNIEKSGNKYYHSFELLDLGWAQTKLKQYDKAEKNLFKGLEIAKEYKLKSAKATAYSYLSELYDKTNDYKKSLAYYKLAKEFGDELSNESNMKYVNGLIIKYDSERKNSKIKSLAKQNEIANLKLVKNRNLWLASISLLALLGILLYYFYKNQLLKNEKKYVKLEQTALRSQMNPHFIFNSLNSIKLYIIDNEKENAVYYLNKFSKLIRKILAATKEKETTLADEIETMKLYMNIENIRFSNAIKSSFNIDKNLNVNTIKVPSLILQPFIENAIWHGLSSKKGDKKINLTFEENNNKFLIITIEDNGVGRKRSSEIKEKKIHKRDSIGIKLTEDRLENFAQSYKNDFSITFIDLYDSENEPRGTKVILKIPLK
jgi:tetratricopeptide (TPR) repeat protein